MPITYRLKPNEKLVIFVHVGVLADDEFLSFYKTFHEEVHLDSPFNYLVDLRRAISSVRSPEVLREFASFMLTQSPKAAVPPKVAVIAPADVSFGLARMYEAYSDLVPSEFIVFRAADAALAWLGVSEDLLD